MLNMLKVQTPPKMTAGSSAGFNIGKVTAKKRWTGLAPSTSAASSSSAGIDCSAPKSDHHERESKPGVSGHVGRKGSQKWENHETGSRPMAAKSPFMAPNCL